MTVVSPIMEDVRAYRREHITQYGKNIHQLYKKQFN